MCFLFIYNRMYLLLASRFLLSVIHHTVILDSFSQLESISIGYLFDTIDIVRCRFLGGSTSDRSISSGFSHSGQSKCRLLLAMNLSSTVCFPQQQDCDRPTVNRWFMHVNVILRCLIQNSNEDALMARWKDAQSTTSETRDENFSA